MTIRCKPASGAGLDLRSTHSLTQHPEGPRRVVFGVAVDVVSQEETVRRIMAWCADAAPAGIVVTPNLAHVFNLQKDERLRAAYARARLVVADGQPLVWMSRLDGGPRLHLVTGSDLIDPICAAAAEQGRSVFLLGSRAAILESAAARLVARHRGLRIAGMHAPPMGFDSSAEARAIAIAAVRAAAADIVLVALGSPKQELWSAEYAEASGAHAIICIGAGLDFIAGARRRAPRLVRRIGAEWLWRAASEPRRLGGRYLRLLVALPMMTIRHFRDRRGA